MSVEELNQRIADLQQQLTTAQAEAVEAKRGRVVISRERKLSKLAGRPKSTTDPDVSDWLADMRQHITELDEPQKIDIIMGHIIGEVSQEVRLRPEAERDTADKILKIIEDSFKDTDSLASLNQKFFNRKQEATETVQSYSRALLKLNVRIDKKGGTALNDSTIITKFIDGLIDQSLKRELRRLAKDEVYTFANFRQKVLELVEDDESDIAQKQAKDRGVTAEKQEPDLAALLQQSLELQKKMFEELKTQRTQNFSSKSSKKTAKEDGASATAATAATGKSDDKDSSRFPPSMRGPCYICGKMGHIAYNCYFNKKNKNKNKDSTEKSEN